MTAQFLPTVLPGDPVPPAPAAAAIQGDWYGDIDPAAFHVEMRVDEKAITPDRVRHALIAAMIRVESDLDTWRIARTAEGAASLAAVPSAQIDGTSRLVYLYRRAVFTAAKAELVEGYPDMDLTGRGERAADQMAPSIADLRRNSLHAVRDMLGVGRTVIDLI